MSALVIPPEHQRKYLQRIASGLEDKAVDALNEALQHTSNAARIRQAATILTDAQVAVFLATLLREGLDIDPEQAVTGAGGVS